MKTETSKYRDLTTKYCYRDDGQPGCGVDLASGGDPVVPWAWQLELPGERYSWYNSNHAIRGAVQLRGHAEHRCAEPNSLDFVYSSHLLEDYKDWDAVLKTWVSMLKPGGKLIILIPDKKLWNAAISKGQPPNCQHQHEGYVGELSKYAEKIGVEVICDQLTALTPDDYSILFVAKRKTL